MGRFALDADSRHRHGGRRCCRTRAARQHADRARGATARVTRACGPNGDLLFDEVEGRDGGMARDGMGRLACHAKPVQNETANRRHRPSIASHWARFSRRPRGTAAALFRSHSPVRPRCSGSAELGSISEAMSASNVAALTASSPVKRRFIGAWPHRPRRVAFWLKCAWQTLASI